MKRDLFLWFSITLLVSGCVAAEPRVWMEKGATLTHYRVLELLPAQNETGKTYDVDVGAILTEHLVSKLRAKNYTVNPGATETKDVLIVRSSLITYEPGSASIVGGAKCIVRTALIDKKTGKLLAEMLTSQSVGGAAEAVLLGGGLLHVAGSLVQSQRILDTVATGIVDELEKRIQEGQAKPD